MPILQVAQPKDHPIVLALIRAYYAYDRLDFAEESIQKGLALLLESPQFGRVFLIVPDNQPIGYTVLTFAFDLEFGGRQAFITDLFIEADYRGQGLGQQVMSELEQFARDEGLKALELQVEQSNTEVYSFYQKLGFQTHDRIPMSKELAKS